MAGDDHHAQMSLKNLNFLTAHSVLLYCDFVLEDTGLEECGRAPKIDTHIGGGAEHHLDGKHYRADALGESAGAVLREEYLLNGPVAGPVVGLAGFSFCTIRH